MGKIEDVAAIMADLKESIVPYFPLIKVFQANAGMGFNMEDKQDYRIMWQIISMEGNKNRSFTDSSEKYSQLRNNILQVDLYVRDIETIESTKTSTKYQVKTKETSEAIKLLIDKFFRTTTVYENIKSMKNVSDWKLIPTMFQDNKYIERWATQFVFPYNDTLEVKTSRAVVGNITINNMNDKEGNHGQP